MAHERWQRGDVGLGSILTKILSWRATNHARAGYSSTHLSSIFL